MSSYPELRAFRDIMFWFKFYCNPDRKSFVNYISKPDEPHDLESQPRTAGKLDFQWDDRSLNFTVNAFGQTLHCAGDPKQKDEDGKVIAPENIPVHRYLTTAVPPKGVKTEDDILYIPELTNYEENAGQSLTQRDSELLNSYLTVPYMRIPLILTFFATGDRIHKLQR